MKEDVAVLVNNVHKSFRLPHNKHNSIKSLFVNIFKSKTTYEKQKVLKGISFEVKKGEFFGIVGRNGGGKSTLLRLLAGIYVPDSGDIKINGRLAPFIELGVGFNPELTGRENVFLNGALLGFSDDEVLDMYDDIVAFAELEKFMDQKLSNYSSGMQVRLAFSVAIQSKANILLIDEVLAVGDTNFQKKCFGVFEDFKKQGRTVIFISHSMEYVREFCDRVVVMDGGHIVHCGSTEKGIDVYNKLNYDLESSRLENDNVKRTEEQERFGTGGAKITSYKIYDHNGKPTIKLSAGKSFKVVLRVNFYSKVEKPAIGIMFRKEKDKNLFGINSFYNKLSIPKYENGDEITVITEGVMPLAQGTYFVSFSISNAKSASNYTELDNLNNHCTINVSGERRWGLLDYTAKMEVKNG